MIAPRGLLVHIYDELLAHGTPPTSREIAEHFGTTPADAQRAMRELRVGKMLLPDPTTGEIWMGGPSSASPTPYTVTAGGVAWWANCAWDMLGIPALLRRPVHIDASCTDCGEPITFDADPADASRD